MKEKNVAGLCLLNGIAWGLVNIKEAPQKLFNSFIAKNLLLDSCHLNLFSGRSHSSEVKNNPVVIAHLSPLSQGLAFHPVVRKRQLNQESFSFVSISSKLACCQSKSSFSPSFCAMYSQINEFILCFGPAAAAFIIFLLFLACSPPRSGLLQFVWRARSVIFSAHTPCCLTPLILGIRVLP